MSTLLKDQCQLAGIVNPHAQFGVGEILPRTAVIAVAFGGEAGGGYSVIPHRPRVPSPIAPVAFIP